jgi:hypothetical protein
LRDAGYLDAGVVEGTGVRTHWLHPESAILGVLFAVAIAAALFVP